MARIAVIGAGMGGMATAARLAVAGHRVEVYERSGTHGGAVGRFERDGFAFDTGPGVLPLPAVYRDLFVKTGREPLEQVVSLRQLHPGARHLFADGTRLDLPDSSRGKAVEAFDGAFGPGVGERWADLMVRAREAWDATRRPLLEEPLRAGAELPAVVRRDPYPRRRSLLRRAPSLLRTAARELGDPRAVSVLAAQVAGFGVDPAQAPAAATVLGYVEHTFGTWYVEGGMRALADALHRRCTERGVRFHFDAEVQRITEADGRAAGLAFADGSTVEADLVVSAAPPYPSEPATHVGGLTRHTVLLALRGPRPTDAAHRTVLHRAGEPSRPVTVLRPDDRRLRPDDDHECVVLTALAPTGAEANPDELLSLADAAGLNLSSRVRWREALDATTVAERTGAPGGVVPAPALGGRPLDALPNTAELPGHYRAGGWAHPGGGLAHAGMSGALAAGLIVEGEDWQGSH